MTALASLLIVIALSFLIVRIGTIALTMTGLSEEVARFQSLSAFSGAGFTTSEAENVANETARRRIISLLIRAGSVGAVSAVATTILTFVDSGQNTALRVLLLAMGAGGILLLARSRRLNRWATPVIRRGLQRFTDLELRDYAAILRLHQDLQISTFEVDEGSWLAGGRLGDLELDAEGVAVLGIERRNGGFRGAPSRKTRLCAGDRIVVYGKARRLQELHDRPEHDEGSHERAKAEHRAEKERDRREDD